MANKRYFTQEKNKIGIGHFDAYDFDSDGKTDIVSSAMGIGIMFFIGKGDRPVPECRV